MEAVDEARFHAAGVAQVYERADRILSGQDVRCSFAPISRGVAAYSAGTRIVFNENMMSNLHTAEDMVIFAGLNYHELAHVMYTPRADSIIRSNLATQPLKKVWNILEDQRIETLLAAQWTSVSDYLVHMMGKHILEGAGEDTLNDLHMFCHGRRYLDSELRDALSKRFEAAYGAEVHATISDCIDEFITLTMADKVSQNRGLQIVRDVYDALRGNNIDLPTDSTHSDERMKVEQGADDHRDSKQIERNQTIAVQAVIEQEEADDDDEPGDGQPGSGKAADGNGDGEGEGQVDGDGEGSGSGAGTSDADIRHMAQTAVDESQNSRFVRENTRDMQKAIKKAAGNDGMNNDGSAVRQVRVSTEYAKASKQFAQVLQRLTIDADPNWKRRTSSGRINIQRVMQGADPDEAFDMWEPGQDDTSDIAMAVLIDNSGSMAGRIAQASEAAWAVKHAVESVGGDVLVLSFQTTTGMVYPVSEKAKRGFYRQMGSAGGTAPADALKRAAHVLSSSSRRKKMLVIITDGAWSGATESEALIRHMNEAGVTTSLGFLSDYSTSGDPHFCQVTVNIGSTMGIVDLAKGIAVASMQTGATS